MDRSRTPAKSFFWILQRERIRRRTCLTREAAMQDELEHIETLCNPERKHTNNGLLASADSGDRRQRLNEAGV